MAEVSPFANAVAAGPPEDMDSPAGIHFAVLYAADALWVALGELPDKAAATLARRRLQETVFWSEQASRPPARSAKE